MSLPDSIDVKDAMLDAEEEVNAIFPEFYMEYSQAELELQLAIKAASMPDDAWALVDQQTKDGVMEVLNAKR
jgi:hypothetical protein